MYIKPVGRRKCNYMSPEVDGRASKYMVRQMVVILCVFVSLMLQDVRSDRVTNDEVSQRTSTKGIVTVDHSLKWK